MLHSHVSPKVIKRKPYCVFLKFNAKLKPSLIFEKQIIDRKIGWVGYLVNMG